MQERVLRTEKSGMSPGFDPRRRQIRQKCFSYFLMIFNDLSLILFNLKEDIICITNIILKTLEGFEN